MPPHTRRRIFPGGAEPLGLSSAKMQTPSASPLAHLALGATLLAGCGDDSAASASTSETGSITTSSSSGSSASTADPTSSASSDSDSSTATLGSDSDPTSSSTTSDDTKGTDTSGSSGSSSSSAGSTTDVSSTSGNTTTGELVDPFDIPFVALDPLLAPAAGLVPPGWSLITSDAAWIEAMGAPVPDELDLENKWLVLGSLGPQAYPGHSLEVDTLTWDDGIVTADGDAIAPGPSCETYAFTWPTAALLEIDPLEVEVDGILEKLVPGELDCADGVGEYGDCNLFFPCASGLLCAGIIRSTVLLGNPYGLCLPEDQAGVFSAVGAPIVDGGPTVELEMNVAGLTSVDMDVVIWVDLDHPAPEDLLIKLLNPSGNLVPVWDHKTGPMHPGGLGIVPTGFSGDESVNGTWTLSVTDTEKNGKTGSVTSWKLEIMSRYD